MSTTTREHCGQLMRYDVIHDGDVFQGQRLTGTWYCERCSTMQPTYTAEHEQPAPEGERGAICKSHGLAVLMTHVNDGEPCSDYLTDESKPAPKGDGLAELLESIKDKLSGDELAAIGFYDLEPTILRDHRLAALVPGLTGALRGLTQRSLSSGPCFCVVQYEGAEPLSLSYFENAGAKTGHDNGFRHNEECLAAREALNAVAKERDLTSKGDTK